MKLTVLGSGTAVPRLNRNMSGYLVETGNKKILFDSGPGIIRQILKTKSKIMDINHIFYTHLHPDHINDLLGILIIDHCNKYKGPLNIYGPKGIKKYFNFIRKATIGKLNYDVNVGEMNDNSISKIDKILIKTKKVKHSIIGVSYRIEYDGKSIVYSGDTDYSNDIIQLSKNADLLVLECSYPDNKKVKGHLIPSLCGKIATKANVKKLVLTHFYPECDKVDIKKQCSKEFDGKIVLAKDCMRVKV
ncbi:MBL fold metallo-hydrolase [Candidatus Woesearchaeota archaeon]|nr:MBL fold metallo-hydrolase [Candidatus Woesearchaeota archaeon]|tara:strand:- start:4104 stop:4841 length:738 start_codon:yes stop_codon:yes gene_type:complete